MSPVIRATAATLAGILNTISSLSGGSNGPAVTDFNYTAVNILPPLPGQLEVGFHTLFLSDYDHHGFPLCDVGNDEIPDAACERPRWIATSLFYPACPPSDNQPKPVRLGEEHFAPVFTPYVLGNISRSAARGPKALHNLMSQAVYEAPACKGQFPMVIFAPTAGGQRQAYTQVASELASLGYVVLAVDHPYVSGVVDRPSDGTVHRSLFGDWINGREARSIQSNDLRFVYHLLVNEEQPLSGLPSWTNDTTVQLDACILGHGSGGQVAQVMAETEVVKCGGPLEGILTLPAPFNEQTTASPGPTADDSRRSVSPPSSNEFSQDFSIDLSRPGLHGLIRFLTIMRDGFLRTFGTLVCSVEGDCGPQTSSKEAPIRKRNAGDDPWWSPKNPYHKDPCYDEDYGYEDDKYEHGPGCYEDKWGHDCDDHYQDDYDDYYDPCDPYDGPYYPPKPYPPKPYPPRPYPPTPYPPPGIFPPNITWPPYGGDRIPNDNLPWDDQWDDYHNDGGDYRWRYGGKYCDHYDGGYDYSCDQGHDHYREWDKKKHHCHGYVDDHDEDDCDDYDDGDYDCHEDDDYDGEDDDDYDGEDEDEYDGEDHDYQDHGDCHEEHHHHGHVDDHHEDEYEDDYGGDEDYGDDHGHVDDWDNEGEK